MGAEFRDRFYRRGINLFYLAAYKAINFYKLIANI